MNRKYTNKQKNQMCIDHFKGGELPVKIASKYHTTKSKVQSILYSFKTRHYRTWLSNSEDEIMRSFKDYCDQQSALELVKPKQYYSYLTSLISNSMHKKLIHNMHCHDVRLHDKYVELAHENEANYHYGLIVSRKLSIVKNMFDNLLDDYSRVTYKNGRLEPIQKSNSLKLSNIKSVLKSHGLYEWNLVKVLGINKATFNSWSHNNFHGHRVEVEKALHYLINK